MTWKLTYKELLLIVGVAVALAIGVVFWSKGLTGLKSSNRTFSIKKASVAAFSGFLEKSIPKAAMQK